MNAPQVAYHRLPKIVILLGVVSSLFYMSWWFTLSTIGNPVLFTFLFAGEIYHTIMVWLFFFTLWPKKSEWSPLSPGLNYAPSIDVFITVAGEPLEIVGRTIDAAKRIHYSRKSIYVLNDGFVAGKDNWQAIESLAKRYGVRCITRQTTGGAKAGNINHALRLTQGEYILILDADMVPHQDIISAMLPYCASRDSGFVQSPQYYRNHSANSVASAAWDQQEIFFGPILMGKHGSNATFMCGTNMLIRRSALVSVGGMDEHNIAEDFMTSIKMHERGWRSFYVPQVLAQGLGPEDMLAYYKQQFRWARGCLQVFFTNNPLFLRKLTLAQRLEYLSSSLFYLGGVVVLVDIVLPLLYLYFRLQPVISSTPTFAFYFIPYIALVLFMVTKASGGSLTFQALSFNFSTFDLKIKAALSVVLGRTQGFDVTPKKKQTGRYLHLVYPHLLYLCLLVIGTGIAVFRDGASPAVITNSAWGLFNSAMFLPYIYATWRA